ncbi:MAG: DNA-3-methyladenine glycosylase [Patescibacteria group bacterium]
MRKILSPRFFSRSGTGVAQALLGKFLVRRIGKTEVALMINEVEVYDGFKDKASQASRGRTKRNTPMFGPAGHAYVYFTYGMHWMLNVVTGKVGYPSAILIRGASQYNGPAKLTKALKIDKRLNEKELGKKTGLWIEDRGVKVLEKDIKKTPRIGIDSSGPVWSKKKLRFILKEKEPR